MTLKKALIHLDMVDLFKTKCQPNISSEKILAWLKTFPRIHYHVKGWFPQVAAIHKLRQEFGCSGAHGGGGHRRTRGNNNLLSRGVEKKSKRTGGEAGHAVAVEHVWRRTRPEFD